jgi:hypothetical protein
VKQIRFGRLRKFGRPRHFLSRLPALLIMFWLPICAKAQINILVQCDAPVYTKGCAAALPAASCSTLAPPSKPMVASHDISTFSALLNGTLSTPVPGDLFSEDFALGASEVWVNGMQITGPAVDCVFDGSLLRVNNVVLPAEPADQEPGAEQLTSLFGAVPSIRSQVDSGVTIQIAVKIFTSDCEALHRQVLQRFDSGAFEDARQLLSNSPAIESFEINEAKRSARIHYRGLSGGWAINSQTSRKTPNTTVPPAPNSTAKARRIVGQIKASIQSSPPDGSLIVVSPGLISVFTGEARSLAHSQIVFAKTKGKMSGAPNGPLTPFEISVFLSSKGQ